MMTRGDPPPRGGWQPDECSTGARGRARSSNDEPLDVEPEEDEIPEAATAKLSVQAV